jgi:RHS repeat-associated protein
MQQEACGGNLTQRQDLRQGLAETFTYDALDRLTLASGPGTQSLSISYDAIGNVLTKTGVSGTYAYHATRKNAVISAGGTAYSYDANGNMTSRGGSTVTWSSSNTPTALGDPSGYSAQFDYAPDRSRWRQVSTYLGTTETTIYVGGLLEKLTTGTRTHWKHLIATPSGQVQVIRRSDGTSETLYVTTDHLGSTDAVLAASGAVLMRGSFRADGARRASHWQGAPSLGEWTEIANSTREGYTGHEMLDNVMLVHMNGRVFDPQLGRFLSADPYVDGADSTQGWNRYAYVHGRFMSATDPSGFAESALEEMFVMAERIRHAAAGVFSFTAGSASAEAPETGLPMDDATGLEELLVQGARIRPGGAAAVPVTPQGDPCPGDGQVTPAPKTPFDPSTPISIVVTDLPAGSISVTAPDGTVFNAPGYADFAGAYAYGQSLRSIPFGLDAFGLQVAVGHGGMYDFQRDGQTFIRPYVYASNYAVGIVLNGAGYSRANAIRVAGGFARLRSSNAGDPAQLSAWTNGWNAAASGSCTRTN